MKISKACLVTLHIFLVVSQTISYVYLAGAAVGVIHSGTILHTDDADITVQTDISYSHLALESHRILINTTYLGIYPVAGSVALSIYDLSLSDRTTNFTADGTNTVYNWTWTSNYYPSVVEVNGSLTSVVIDRYLPFRDKVVFRLDGSGTAGAKVNCSFNGRPAYVTSDEVDIPFDYNVVTKIANFTVSLSERDIEVVWAIDVNGDGYGTDYGILNMEGCGNWVFAGDTYYIFFANVTSSFGGEKVSLGVGFYDMGNWFSIFYNSTTEGTTLTAPGDAISGSTYSVTTDGNNVYILWLINFKSNIIDDSNIDLYLRVVETGGVDTGWFTSKPAYFNIYNIGQYVSYGTEGTGAAGRKVAGAPFEIWASGVDGSIRANVTYKNFQHIHFLVAIEQPDVCQGGAGAEGWDAETWYAEYGIDFCYNDTWYEGLVVRFELLEGKPSPWDGLPATVAWVYTKWNVTWFYAGTVIKSDVVYGYWEGYKSDKDWTRMWVDLWFSNINGSSVIAGRTNSYYFGMHKGGFLWWTSWDPHMSNATQSSAFHNLVAGPFIISSKQIVLMKVWAKVAKKGAVAITTTTISELSTTTTTSCETSTVPATTTTSCTSTCLTGDTCTTSCSTSISTSEIETTTTTTSTSTIATESCTTTTSISTSYSTDTTTSTSTTSICTTTCSTTDTCTTICSSSCSTLTSTVETTTSTCTSICSTITDTSETSTSTSSTICLTTTTTSETCITTCSTSDTTTVTSISTTCSTSEVSTTCTTTRSTSTTTSSIYSTLTSCVTSSTSVTTITLTTLTTCSTSVIGVPSCPHKIQLRDYEFFNLEFAQEGYMEGIDTPSFMESKEPGTPQTSSFAALVAALIDGITVPIVRAIKEALSAGLSMTAGFINTLFAQFGVEKFVDTMTTSVTTWGEFFIESVLAVTLLIVQIFTLLRAITGFVISWFTRFITFFAGPNGLFINVVKILDGTHSVVTGVVNVWSLMNFSTWIDAVPIFAAVAWFDSIDKRAKRMGGGWFAICIGDLQIASWILSYIMDMMFRVINFVMDIVFRLVNTIKP